LILLPQSHVPIMVFFPFKKIFHKNTSHVLYYHISLLKNIIYEKKNY
jgi:hypothetical protein